MLKQYKKLTETSFKGEDQAQIEFMEFFRKTNFINNSLLFPVDFYGKTIFSPVLMLANNLYPSNVWINERDIIDEKWLVDVDAKPIPSASVQGKKVFWSYFYNISDIKNMYSPSDAVARNTPIDSASATKIIKQIVEDFEYDFETSKKPTQRISNEYRLFSDKYLYQINKDEIIRGSFHLLYHSCIARKRTKVVFNSDLTEQFFSLILATNFRMKLEVNDRIRSYEWLKINALEFMNAYTLAWVFLEQVAYDSQIVSDNLEFEDGYVRTKPLSYQT
jgi:hypothetical protein